MPFWQPQGPQARCPHCDALERHRFLWRHLRSIVHAGDRVLHFAPESVIARNILEIPGVNYTAADLNPESLGAATGLSITRADITNQPWPDDSFDVAIISHVLEHVPDDAAAMNELRRVTTSQGLVVSQHPYDPARASTLEDPTVVAPDERVRMFGQADHVRMYGRDLPDRWQRAGFEIKLVFPDVGPGSTIIEARAQTR
jgi:SAM-dependent methyltransferase